MLSTKNIFTLTVRNHAIMVQELKYMHSVGKIQTHSMHEIEEHSLLKKIN